MRHVTDRPQVEGERPGVEEQRHDRPEEDDNNRRLHQKAKEPRLETQTWPGGWSFLLGADFEHLLASTTALPLMETP